MTLKANWINCNRPASDFVRQLAEEQLAKIVTEKLGKDLVREYNIYKSPTRGAKCAFEMAEMTARIRTFDDSFAREGLFLPSEIKDICIVWELK